VSAARAITQPTENNIPQAEQAMRDLGQHPLFMIRPEDDALDMMLDTRGYSISDPTALLSGDIAGLAQQDFPNVTAFTIWPPLQIMYDLWHEAGTDPARFKIMSRVQDPKTALLGRVNDRPAGVAFAAISGETVMVHALEIDSKQRRNGLATYLMRAIARWGVTHGATQITLAVTRENSGALALYHSLGMEEIGGYHYRKAPQS